MFQHPAHPRSRGENLVGEIVGLNRIGSSPLTRGKQSSRNTSPARQGLIPAHAGKTRGTGHYRPAPAAHPRSRGENAGVSMEDMGAIGSSPLTRGKLQYIRSKQTSTRLIPAHAGKTLGIWPDGLQAAAHPRSRGENPAAVSTRLAPAGSSPLTRGKRLVAAIVAPSGRLIPAHAGKTASRRRCRRRRTAHPRSRGENARTAAITA